MRYPYSRPHLQEEDFEKVMSVLKGQYLTQGPVVDQLEESLRDLFGVKHAIVCNSGTAALHMAYDALELGPNDGLITSAVTFLATANAARMCGAPVGFADIDPRTGNVTLATLKSAVERAPFNVRAISIVHLGGRPCRDIVLINEYANSIGAQLIEDACHAPLAKYPDYQGNLFTVGSCSHSSAATMSFHAIKHITAGEGGVLLTNDERLAETARLLRSHGMVRNPSKMKNKIDAHAPWYYEMHELGYNYRLSDVNCALAIGQISRLRKNIERRAEIAQLYNNYFSNSDSIRTPEFDHGRKDSHSWHLYAPAIDFQRVGKSREEVMHELYEKGIGTQVHYIPLYRQPYYQAENKRLGFPGSENYFKKTLSLPMYFGLDDVDVRKISEQVILTLEG